MSIQKLTKEQAIIVSGFTGVLCGDFNDFHKDAEKRLGRGILTFEFGDKDFMKGIKELYKNDFIEMGTIGNK